MSPFQFSDLDTITMLAFEHAAGATPHVIDAPASTRLEQGWLIATLVVSGPWHCTVMLAVEPPLAESLTLAMLDEQAVTLVEVQDAIGELANVIAGGVKGMTPVPGCDLSTPVVTHGPLAEMLLAPSMARFYSVASGLVCLSVTL